jgi:enoyl-CoA hydratase/carnithine racemase
MSNQDINAREYIGAGASSSVVVNCETIKGPGFVISILAAEALAGTLGMPEGRGKALAEIEAHSWAAQGFVPGQPDKVVASAIRRHVPQMAEIKAQVYAGYEQGLDAAVADANRRMAASFGRPDFKEGVTSFVEKRAPAFPGLPPLGSGR